MNSTLKRKKLLRILNYTAEQKEIVKFLDVPVYHQFAEVIENRTRYIETYTDKDIDDLIQFFEKLIKVFEKKGIKKDKIEEWLIKAPVHSIKQKFGSEPILGQISIFDKIENKELIQEAKNLSIKIIGWDLTRAEDMAVFAIYKIYSKYGYRGNVNNNDSVLAFTLPEYYEAYGVKKYKSGNKERFSNAEKNQAFYSLLSLRHKECFTAYNQLDPGATKKKKRQIFNRIETLENIIPKISFLYIGIDGKEIEKPFRDKTKKLKAIKITPSEVFLDQIGNYYALLPANLYLELKEKLPGVKNKHLSMFIQWLFMEIALRRREALRRKKDLSNIIDISFKKLSYILRMDSWIKTRQPGRINNRLKECFEWAKSLEYLNWYKICRGKKVSKKVILGINLDKLKQQKQAGEIIYNSDPKEEFEEAQEREIYQEKLKNSEKVKDPEVVIKSKEKIHKILSIKKKLNELRDPEGDL